MARSFVGARVLSAAEIERNNRLGDLFEDVVGSENGEIRLPGRRRVQLESALAWLKHAGKIAGYVDLRPQVKEHYRQERTHGKPDFWVLLLNLTEVEIEVKNNGKKMKDHPRPGWAPWFLRDVDDIREDCRKDWNPIARRLLVVTFLDLYTPIALDWGRKYLDGIVEANEHVTETSNFVSVRNYLIVQLHDIFKTFEPREGRSS